MFLVPGMCQTVTQKSNCNGFLILPLNSPSPAPAKATFRSLKDFLHVRNGARNIIHRDIKPANMLLASAPSSAPRYSGEVKIEIFLTLESSSKWETQFFGETKGKVSFGFHKLSDMRLGFVAMAWMWLSRWTRMSTSQAVPR